MSFNAGGDPKRQGGESTIGTQDADVVSETTQSVDRYEEGEKEEDDGRCDWRIAKPCADMHQWT